MPKTVGHTLRSLAWLRERKVAFVGRLLLFLAYPLLLFWVYATMISPRFVSLGFVFRDPPIFLFLVSLGVAVFIGMLLPRAIARPSDLVVWMLYLICVSPATTVGLYATNVELSLVFWCSISLALSFGVCILITRISIPNIRLPRLSPRVFWGLMIGLTVVCYLYLAFFVGFRLKFLSLADIYNVRVQFKEQLASAPALAGYIYPLIGRVLNPLFIIWGITTRRWVPIVLGVVGELVLYLTVGSKTFLFSSVAVIAVCAFFSWIRSRRTSVLLFIVIGGVGLCALIDLAMRDKNIWLSSLFTRRFLMTPGIQTSAYVDTFSHKDLAFYGDSVLRWFVHYPYSQPLPKVVGETYWHSTTLYANGNVFADGFANLGPVGFLIVAILVGGYLQAVNIASRELSLTFASAILVLIALSFCDTAFFTSLLTGGGLFVLVALIFMPKSSAPPETGDRAVRKRWRVRQSKIPSSGSVNNRIPGSAHRFDEDRLVEHTAHSNDPRTPRVSIVSTSLEGLDPTS